MAGNRLFEAGTAVTDRDKYRLVEPEMTDDEYAAYHAAWWSAYPCKCDGICGCQGPPPKRPRKVRIRVELQEEPPALTPAAARALLRILLKADEAQRPEANSAENAD